MGLEKYNRFRKESQFEKLAQGYYEQSDLPLPLYGTACENSHWNGAARFRDIQAIAAFHLAFNAMRTFAQRF